MHVNTACMDTLLFRENKIFLCESLYSGNNPCYTAFTDMTPPWLTPHPDMTPPYRVNNELEMIEGQQSELNDLLASLESRIDHAPTHTGHHADMQRNRT